MKKSKYLGMTSGDWQCTHVGVARVQPAFRQRRATDGARVRSKYPGHQAYYYIFERLTSDKKAMKMVRLNAAQARMVFNGVCTVEQLAEKKSIHRSTEFTNKVSYSFCD